MAERWGRRAFRVDAETMAQRLIGATLVRTLDDGTQVGGMIVETEAYVGIEDAAAHSHGGRRTPRNASMYAQAGTAYVYFTYGMHHCFNVVCGSKDEPVAVLIRALEPTIGLDTMTHARTTPRRKSPLRERDLCSGPAKLCQALSIDRGLDGIDLTTDARLELRGNHGPVGALTRTTRIGVDYAGPWSQKPLRWLLRGSEHVSVPARDEKLPRK